MLTCTHSSSATHLLLTGHQAILHHAIYTIYSQQAVLARAMRFIGVGPPTDDAGWAPILSPDTEVAGSRPKGGTPPMAEATRELLRSFYTPGLRELLWLLRDEPDAAEWRAWSEV